MENLKNPFKILVYYLVTRHHIYRIKRRKGSNRVKKAMLLAYSAHYNVLQYYGNTFYFYHLEMVANNAKKYSHLLAKHKRATAIAAAYCHDTIEDCGLSYNDVKVSLGKAIADAVYNLTNEKGKNRAQRGGDKYYNDMKNDQIAVYVKICDRLANIEHSKSTGSIMYDKYKSEYVKFKEKLYRPEFDSMFDDMEKIIIKRLMHKNKKIVFTGTAGTGKTTIFEKFRETSEFHMYDESARELIKFFGTYDPSKLPHNHPTFFQRMIESKQIGNWFESESVQGPAIFDRCAVDEVAYRKFFDIEVSLNNDLIRYCNYDMVFFFPYWEKIFANDSERKESKEEAQRLSELIQKAYKDLGYDVIIVPKVSVEERFNFINNKINKL